jgi:cell wall-active antibiotic response 4TMS protein YvqF
MSSTVLDDQRFERVAPTWEVGRPAPERPTPSQPSDRGVRIAVAVAVVLTVITTTLAAGAIVAGFAFGLPMSGGVGQRTPHPQSAADLADGFELTAGQMRLDLRDVAFPAGTTRTKVDVGFGEATVIVPRGVEVVVDGRVVAGQVESFGRAEDGLGVDTTQASGAGPRAPRLEIDGRVGFGQLRVVRGG